MATWSTTRSDEIGARPERRARAARRRGPAALACAAATGLCLAVAGAAGLGAPAALAQTDTASAGGQASVGDHDVLGGGYIGIDSAQGWRMLLAPVDVNGRAAFDGVFIDEKGQSTGFVAFGDGANAEAQVVFSNGEAFFRIEARPIGMMLRWVPINEDGQLAVEATQSFPFIRDDVSMPAEPDDLATPPNDVSSSFNSIAFVKSYEFWTPEQTGRAYASMTPQSRTLIKLYSAVHTDILWKLCQARTTPEGLSEALDGQSIDCPTLLSTMADIQRRGVFASYKSDLAPERAALLDAMRCATGTLRPRDLCIEISKGTSQRALSLDTAATIIERY